MELTDKEKQELIGDALEKEAIKYAQDKYMPVQTSQAFKAGAQWQKQQMMKEAVDVGIDSSRSDGKTVLSGNFFRYNTGDKVKIIIVKED